MDELVKNFVWRCGTPCLLEFEQGLESRVRCGENLKGWVIEECEDVLLNFYRYCQHIWGGHCLFGDSASSWRPVRLRDGSLTLLYFGIDRSAVVRRIVEKM